jgi:hypothetical protein
MKGISNYDLETKVAGLSADNTNTNFGGLLRRGKENVLTKINSQLNRNIIGFGCSAHIIHDFSKTAFYSMLVGNEVLVTKNLWVISHMHCSCTTAKRFCDFAGEEYKQILGYPNVRRLSLFPASERILKIYPSLKSFFYVRNTVPESTETIFENSEPELRLSFAHSQASHFYEPK